jgi:uncharacterized protein (TIGR00369 family)
MTDATPAVDLAALQHILDRVVADWVKALGLRLLEARPGEVVLALPVAPALVHGGGVLCGQAMMAAADTAMVLAVSSQLGGFRAMTTVQLQTSFLRPIAGNGAGDSGQARLVARVLRAGKSLVFGEVEIFDAAGRLAAHTTTTYALL